MSMSCRWIISTHPTELDPRRWLLSACNRPGRRRLNSDRLSPSSRIRNRSDQWTSTCFLQIIISFYLNRVETTFDRTSLHKTKQRLGIVLIVCWPGAFTTLRGSIPSFTARGVVNPQPILRIEKFSWLGIALTYCESAAPSSVAFWHGSSQVMFRYSVSVVYCTTAR